MLRLILICCISLISLTNIVAAESWVIPIVKYDPLNYQNIINSVKESCYEGSNYISISPLKEQCKIKYNSRTIIEKWPCDILKDFPTDIVQQESKIFILDLNSFYLSTDYLQRRDKLVSYIGVIKDDESFFMRKNDSNFYTLSELLILEYGTMDKFINTYLADIKLAMKYDKKLPESSIFYAKEYLKNDFCFYRDNYHLDYKKPSMLLYSHIEEKFNCTLSEEVKRKIVSIFKKYSSNTIIDYAIYYNYEENNIGANLSKIENEVVEVLSDQLHLDKVDTTRKIRLLFKTQQRERVISYNYLVNHLFYKNRSPSRKFPTDKEEFLAVSTMVYNE